MLMEACLLKGFVFYKHLLKRPQERQEDTGFWPAAYTTFVTSRLIGIVSTHQDLVLSDISEKDPCLPDTWWWVNGVAFANFPNGSC